MNCELKDSDWWDIPGWDGCYQASRSGSIRSLDREVRSRWGAMRIAKGRILKPKVTNRGYLMVNLLDSESGKKSSTTVHRLVALTFLPNADGLPEVNHIDGVKANCAASNLEWCSRSKNCQHAARLRLNPVPKLTDSQVRDVRRRHIGGEGYGTLAAAYGIDKSSIKAIVKGESYAWT